MKRIAAIGLCLALALAPYAHAQSLAGRHALDFGSQAAFGQSVTARYAGLTHAQVLADARAQGFSCSGDSTYCTRSVTDGSCTNAWTIDLVPGESIGSRFARLCMGADEDE